MHWRNWSGSLLTGLFKTKITTNPFLNFSWDIVLYLPNFTCMEKKWLLLKTDQENITALHAALKIHEALCRILIQRSIDTFEKARAFFRPTLRDLHDPWLMKDMQKAVDRIVIAIQKKEKILIYGDYDVDGTTSVASFYAFLKNHHTHLDYYIPHRHKEGYGISKLGIDYAIQQKVDLIISIDCGIKANELVAYAAKNKIDFIICDHHLPDHDVPRALAILNPKQKDCTYPYKELCGCGIGFKLMQALAKTMQLEDETYLKMLDLVALAIAADIVPMTGENRILAYYGLLKINKEPNKGIEALIKLSGLTNTLHITNLVFGLAPRINAAGRMDDARKVVQLFIEDNKEKAMALAEQLHFDNTNRKEADKNITAEALTLIKQDTRLEEKKTTVVYGKNWHKGVIGIVASRLIETYYRPTIVLTKSGDIVAGSARSVPGFNVYEAVHACRKHLLGYGGHFAAAGMTLLEENVTTFAEAFETEVAQSISPGALIPRIEINAEINLSDITDTFYKVLLQMEPFGPDNMRPVFLCRNVRDTGYSKIVKDDHIRFVLTQNNVSITGIGFNMADKFNYLANKSPIDIVFTIDENVWNGVTNLQLGVIDLEQHNSSEQYL